MLIKASSLNLLGRASCTAYFFTSTLAKLCAPRLTARLAGLVLSVLLCKRLATVDTEVFLFPDAPFHVSLFVGATHWNIVPRQPAPHELELLARPGKDIPAIGMATSKTCLRWVASLRPVAAAHGLTAPSWSTTRPTSPIPTSARLMIRQPYDVRSGRPYFLIRSILFPPTS